MAWTPQEKKRVARIEERMKHAGFPVTDEPDEKPEADEPEPEPAP